MQILPFFFFLFSFLGLVRKYFWMDFSCPTLGARLEANSMTTLRQRKNVFPFLINRWIYIPLFKRKNNAFTLTVLVIKVIISLVIYKLLYTVYASYRSTDLILADAKLCFWDRWEVECWGEEWGPPLSIELQLRRKLALDKKETFKETRSHFWLYLFDVFAVSFISLLPCSKKSNPSTRTTFTCTYILLSSSSLAPFSPWTCSLVSSLTTSINKRKR